MTEFLVSAVFFIRKTAKVIFPPPLSDRRAIPISARVQTRLLRQAGGLSKRYSLIVNKARGRVVFETTAKRFGL